MKKERSSTQEELKEAQRNVLSREEVRELCEKFGLTEEGPSLVLEAKNERGETVRHFFPKVKKYPRAPEAGGGSFDLREEIEKLRSNH